MPFFAVLLVDGQVLTAMHYAAKWGWANASSIHRDYLGFSILAAIGTLVCIGVFTFFNLTMSVLALVNAALYGAIGAVFSRARRRPQTDRDNDRSSSH
jgi:hypothetical protein